MIYLTLFLFNLIVGATVLAFIDDEEENLYKWYAGCPDEISFIVQPLTLSFWFIVVIFWYKNKIK